MTSQWSPAQPQATSGLLLLQSQQCRAPLVTGQGVFQASQGKSIPCHAMGTPEAELSTIPNLMVFLAGQKIAQQS